MKLGYLGYDTVHLWLAEEDVLGGIPIERVVSVLEGVRHTAEQDTDEIYSIGMLGGLNVAVFQSGISVKGSLGKFYAQAEYGLLPSHKAANCIKLLSETLGVPMEKAKITRLDLACDFIVQHPPKSYYDYLGNSGVMEREQIGGSLYYSIVARQLVFYDKSQEMKNKLPSELKGKKILRVELRLIRNLTGQLNIAHATAAMLSDVEVFGSLVHIWWDNYRRILKSRDIATGPGSMPSPSDLEKHLLRQQIRAAGGIHEVLNMCDRYALEFSWPQRTKNRHKEKLIQIAQHPDYTVESKLIKELDSLVKQAMEVQQEELKKNM